MAEETSKPKPPPPVPLVNVQTGKREDVPYSEAHQKLLSGTYSVGKGEELPVRSADGFVTTAPLAELPRIVRAGGRIATRDEFSAAEKQEKYHGPGHTAAAAAAGFADTMTFGVAPAVAGAVSDDAGKYLTEVQEAHPLASAGGQVAGLIAPIAADVLSGGTATPLVGAEVAGTVARAGRALEGATALTRAGEGVLGVERAAQAAKAVEAARLAGEAAPLARPALAEGGSVVSKVLNAPMRPVQWVGGLAERAAEKIVGTEATSLAGKMGQRAVAVGARGAAEGAVISAAHQASEEIMHHTPEGAAGRVLAAGGMGALLGGGFGSVLGAGGVGLRRAIAAGADRGVMSALDQTGHLESALSKAERQELRQRMIADGVLQAGDQSVAKGGQGAELLGRIAQAENRALNEQASFFARVSEDPALPKIARSVAFRDVLESAASHFGDRAISSLPPEKAAQMLQARNFIFEGLGVKGGGLDSAAQLARIKAVRPEMMAQAEVVQAALTKARTEAADALEKGVLSPAAIDKLEEVRAREDHLQWMARSADREADRFDSVARVPLKVASDLQSSIQEVLGREGASAVSPEAQRAVRGFRADLSSKLESSFDGIMREAQAAVEKSGSADAPAVKAAIQALARKNHDVNQAVRLYREASTAAHLSAGVAKGSRFGDVAARLPDLEKATGAAALGSALVAGAGAGSALLHGGAGYVAAKGLKAAWSEGRKRAAATAAVAAERILSIREVERVAKRVDRQVASKVDELLSSVDSSPKAREFLGRALGETFEERSQAILSLAAGEGELTFRVQQATGSLAFTAPKTVAHMEVRAIQTLNYLVQTMPQAKPNPSSLTGDAFPIPEGEKVKWLRRYEVAVDPMSSLDRLKNNSMTPEEIETWKVAHPELKEKVGEHLVAGIQAQGKKGAKEKAATKAQSRTLVQAAKSFVGVPLISPATSAVISRGSQGQVPGGAPSPQRGGGGPPTRPLKGTSENYGLRGASRSKF